MQNQNAKNAKEQLQSTSSQKFKLYLALGEQATSSIEEDEYEDLQQEDIKKKVFQSNAEMSAFCSGLDAMVGWGNVMEFSEIDPAFGEKILRRHHLSMKKKKVPMVEAGAFSLKMIFGGDACAAIENNHCSADVISGLQQFDFSSNLEIDAFRDGISEGDGWMEYLIINEGDDTFLKLKDLNLIPDVA
jgi:hypothetical protein